MIEADLKIFGGNFGFSRENVQNPIQKSFYGCKIAKKSSASRQIIFLNTHFDRSFLQRRFTQVIRCRNINRKNKEKKETTDIFEVMEKRLFFYIMRPAMIFTWVFGLALIYLNGIDIFSQFWFQIKIVLVILLSAYNDYLGKCLVALKNSTNIRSAKFFRIINEIPTVILIIVVFLAIFKPI